MYLGRNMPCVKSPLLYGNKTKWIFFNIHIKRHSFLVLYVYEFPGAETKMVNPRFKEDRFNLVHHCKAMATWCQGRVIIVKGPFRTKMLISGWQQSSSGEQHQRGTGEGRAQNLRPYLQ